MEHVILPDTDKTFETQEMALADKRALLRHSTDAVQEALGDLWDMATKILVPGTRVSYRHGQHEVMATVVHVSDYYHAGVSVRIRGGSGKEYWKGVEALTVES